MRILRSISKLFFVSYLPNMSVIKSHFNTHRITTTIKHQSHPRIFKIFLLSFLTITQTSCMLPPAHSDIRAEGFKNETLFANRVYILAYLDKEFASNVGKPLTESLVRQFQQRGMEATATIQLKEHAIPNETVYFQKAAKFSPDAIVLVRIGKAYFSSSDRLDLIVSPDRLDWTVTFDMLDAQEKGVWKGNVHLFRISEIRGTSESIAEKMVSNLFNNGVLALKGLK